MAAAISLTVGIAVLGARRPAALPPSTASEAAPSPVRPPPQPIPTAESTPSAPPGIAKPSLDVPSRAAIGTGLNTSTDTAPRDSALRPRSRPTAEAPDLATLVRRIDRIEKLLQAKAGKEAPADLLALLDKFRSDARDAESAEERRDLARKLQNFEQKFLVARPEGPPR